ncbi:MAG: hypothetical protein AB1422_05145 [bacterium]
MKEKNVWCKIIEAVTAPLGFFVLALLIVESFLAIVLTGGKLEKNDQMIGIYIGIALFVFVTILVFILVWHKPKNLTFDKESHLIDQGKAPFGTDSTTVLNRDKLLPTEANGKGGNS